MKTYSRLRGVLPGYILASLKSDDGGYSRLGDLFSDQCEPQFYLYDLRPGDKQQLCTYHGPLYQQLEQVAEYISDNAGAAFGSKYLTQEIVRTILLNATFYKDYSKADSPIRVTIDGETLKVVYPVNDINSYTVDGLFNAIIHPTNPQIEDMFVKLKLGTILEADLGQVNKLYQKLGNESVCLKLSSYYVVIRLPFCNEARPLKGLRDKEWKILTLMAYWACDVTRATLEQALALPLSTTNNALKSLIAKGLVERHGNGKSTTYRLR